MRYEISTSGELEKVLANQDTDKQILLTEGVYELEHTLELKSGTKITGVKGKTLLKGSRRISLEGLQAGKDGVITVDLELAGIRDLGRFGQGPYADFWSDYDIPKPHMEEEGPSLQLYYEGKSMHLSRYPENGEIRIAEAFGSTPIYNGKHAVCGCREGVFRPSDVSIFEKEDWGELLLAGYWYFDWATQKQVIEHYDSEKGIVSLKPPHHIYGYNSDLSDHRGGRFYVLNARSAIRKPGDWCINRREKKVYLYPWPGQTYVDISVCENIFQAKNQQGIVISDISFTSLRRSAVWLEDCADVLVENCTINNCGSWAIVTDCCKDTTVRGCQISNTGAGGIAVSGGDRDHLIGSNILVEKNEIHDIAYWVRTYMPAIELKGVGVRVNNNKIWDVPHFAIDFQGNNHIIEGNEIRNACFESNDAGAIYAGADCTCLGNIIRNNYIYDMFGLENKGCVSIYFDDGFAGAEVYGNILANNPGVGIMIGGGREINIHHNMFFECGYSLHMDRRATNWAGNQVSRLLKNMEKVDCHNGIWQAAYPLLERFPQDHPELPKYNSFTDNTVIGGMNIVIESIEDVGTGIRIENNAYVKRNENPQSVFNVTGWYNITENT